MCGAELNAYLKTGCRLSNDATCSLSALGLIEITSVARERSLQNITQVLTPFSSNEAESMSSYRYNTLILSQTGQDRNERARSQERVALMVLVLILSDSSWISAADITYRAS